VFFSGRKFDLLNAQKCFGRLQIPFGTVDISKLDIMVEQFNYVYFHSPCFYVAQVRHKICAL
jgi:hypothetical protein